MKRYIFEVLPDGSIGARYYFDCCAIPAQTAKPGSSFLDVPLTGDEEDAELDLLMEARNRPHAIEVRNGKIEHKRGHTERG